ncbi:MAG: DUF1848 domain-containing protein [Treponema sp.]|nr:DUF1848 domain-containing protein [Treponema sp.]
MIVSVSRRCDIPRFQFEWFMEKINMGFVDVANPFNAAQIKRVPLVPAREGMRYEEGVDAFVFWTRDPGRILANADELSERGFPFYVMVSLTGYPDALEPNQPLVPQVIESIKELAQKIGSERVIWRYDPVILTSITDEKFHYWNFKGLAQNLSGSVKRVIISIFDEYKGAMKRLSALEKEGKIVMRNNDVNDDNFLGILLNLYECTIDAGMEIQSCAEKIDYQSIGIKIKQGACIDAELIEKICGIKIDGKDKNQRQHCLCCKSVDIGAYNTCASHCVYCYAWR